MTAIWPAGPPKLKAATRSHTWNASFSEGVLIRAIDPLERKFRSVPVRPGFLVGCRRPAAGRPIHLARPSRGLASKSSVRAYQGRTMIHADQGCQLVNGYGVDGGHDASSAVCGTRFFSMSPRGEIAFSPCVASIARQRLVKPDRRHCRGRRQRLDPGRHRSRDRPSSRVAHARGNRENHCGDQAVRRAAEEASLTLTRRAHVLRSSTGRRKILASGTTSSARSA